VEVKIGVQHAPRELLVESNLSADEIQQAVENAMQGDNGVFSLIDERGRRVLIPAERLAYVEIGEPETRRVGFGAM
jgi:uncharacterized protein DUF3107